jgi:6-phosphogluconate dehydrogenase
LCFRPGGNSDAWPHTKNILQAIAAKVNGKSCCSWIGEDGAGPYIKTVHNGIGYADMQLLAEAYHMLKDIARMNPLEISKVCAISLLCFKENK